LDGGQGDRLIVEEASVYVEQASRKFHRKSCEYGTSAGTAG
jgi:hypothetical protein